MIQTTLVIGYVHSNGQDGGTTEHMQFYDDLNRVLKGIQAKGGEIIDIKYSTIPPTYHTDSDGRVHEPHYQGEYTALVIYNDNRK